MNEPNPKYNDYGPIDIGGRRPKGGYAVVALDPESGVGQDGDYVQRYRDAVAWARQMARGDGVYRGGGLIESSAIVYADFGPSEERVTLYSISPPGFPVWKEEQRGQPVELNPPKGQLQRWRARHHVWHVGDHVSFLDDEGKRRWGEIVRVRKKDLVIDADGYEWGIAPQFVIREGQRIARLTEDQITEILTRK
jgi:hypothetical protein